MRYVIGICIVTAFLLWDFLYNEGRYITYTAETSKRIMRFDVVAERQLPDLVRYPGDDIRDGNWAIALRYLADGRLLVTRGKTTVMVSTPTEAEELAAFLNYCNIQDLSG